MLLDMDDDGFDNQEEAVPTKKNTSAEGGAKSRGSASASSSSRAKKTQHNRTVSNVSRQRGAAAQPKCAVILQCDPDW